jgi:hypothetical protein
MNHLLERADPAISYETDPDRLRALVDERIGHTPLAKPRPRPTVRPWVIAAASFAGVLTIAIPFLLSHGGSSQRFPVDEVSRLPGVEAVIPLASGGVQTMGIDGDDIWVVTALQNSLQRVSMQSNQIEETFPIDGYVEGVIVGGGHVWLLSYDNGGEVLRFNPATGLVDRTTPLGGLPNFAHWFGGALFASNDQGEVVEISADGDVLSRAPGTVKGDGLGRLWIFDPDDGSIRSLSPDGSVGELVIPGSTPELGDLSQVRRVDEAGGYLWLIFGDASEDIGRFDPTTGELRSFHVGRWLHSLTEHDGALWVTSSTDELLIRVDLETGEVRRFAVPGKPGGLESVGGDLWVLLHQPGSLLRLDTSAELIEMGDEVISVSGGSDSDLAYRLTCTLSGVDSETMDKAVVDHDFAGLGPTIILDTPSWTDTGIWSVVQAQIQGHVVCASGYTTEGATPNQRAADLKQALSDSGVPGPYVLVTAGDAVHTARLFAQGRDDISGVVLVEPMPIGFQNYYDSLLGDQFSHPNWLDLDPKVSDSLQDFGDMPVAVIGHDPRAVFLADQFVQAAGAENAKNVSDRWQEGIDFYAGLSANSHRIVVSDTGIDGVIWFRPGVVLDAVLETIDSNG